MPPRHIHRPGLWLYCNSYWYDYHVTDVVVVKRYAASNYNVDLISYVVSGDLMYALVRDGGDTYLQVYDNEDNLLAEQAVSRKYKTCQIDRENGGCWVMKKKNKDPMLFLYFDGKLMIYEAD